MYRDPIHDLAESRPVTLADTFALDDDPPSSMSDKQKRELAKFRSRYESQGRATMRQRYDMVCAGMIETRAAIASRTEGNAAEVEEIQRSVKAGRLSVEDARKRLAAIFRQIQDDRRMLDSLDTSAERAQDMINQSPVDYQAENLKRFPMLASRLPILSVAWLSGSDDRDPFGGDS